MHSAVRQVPEGGYREEAGFLGDTDRIFSYRHIPTVLPRFSVVICSSIGADFDKNYHREVLLARKLASRGVAVQRFHYRGMGNSDGEPENIDLEGLVRDAAEVTGHFLSSVQDRPVAFVGTRIAAIILARVASDFPGSPLAIWEPVIEVEDYIREALRSRSIRDLKAGITTNAKIDIEAELEGSGYLDLLGYPMHRCLYDSLSGTSLLSALPSGSRPVLIVQMRQRDEISPAYQELSERFAEGGAMVTFRGAGVSEPWWLHDEHAGPVGRLLDDTLGWLLDLPWT